jgi:hypothetical protein
MYAKLAGNSPMQNSSAGIISVKNVMESYLAAFSLKVLRDSGIKTSTCQVSCQDAAAAQLNLVKSVKTIKSAMHKFTHNNMLQHVLHLQHVADMHTNCMSRRRNKFSSLSATR